MPGHPRHFLDSWMTGSNPSSESTGVSSLRTPHGHLKPMFAQTVSTQKQFLTATTVVGHQHATVLGVGSISQPILHSGPSVEWDGSLTTIQKQARLYLGPDIQMEEWLTDLFGDDPGGATSLKFRSQGRFTNGRLLYHDILALARQWDLEGPAQPQEFVRMLRLETDG